MAYRTMAYVIMAYIAMAYRTMAYIIMAYNVMAYIVMALEDLGWTDRRASGCQTHGKSERDSRTMATIFALIEESVVL